MLLSLFFFTGFAMVLLYVYYVLLCFSMLCYVLALLSCAAPARLKAIGSTTRGMDTVKRSARTGRGTRGNLATEAKT